MIKGIIFDLDGTTLNTLLDMHFCINKMLKDFHFPEVSIEQVRAGVGHGYRPLVASVVPQGTSEDVIDQATEVYKNYYTHGYNVKTKPYDGVKELLNTLQDKGYQLAVNSNKGNDITNELISINFPEIKFISIIGAREGIPNKPDPTSANEIVEKMGLRKEEVAYIGDSESDIKTAQNAQLKIIACAYGFRDKQDLIKAGATTIIDQPLDLLKVL